MANGNSLSDYNLGFKQDEYDALDEWGQQKYLREFGRQSADQLARSAGDMTRAYEQRARDVGASADPARRAITQQTGEAWRQGVGAAGAGPSGGGAMAMLAQLGSQGGATRAAFEAQHADRMGEANIAAAQARQEAAGAQAMYSQFLAEMGTEGDFERSMWGSFAAQREALKNNFGEDKKGLGRAFISQASQYEPGHPMRERWIQAAFDQGVDRAVADAMRDMGMDEFSNMTAYGMPAGYEDEEKWEARRMRPVKGSEWWA